ncbi:glucose-6-phosphate dehydrogenase [Verrucomicrobium sp. 3C]|uniref:glucose-6-phosphate dehydrogenase n=1 Tax=Verrucomicrobium sp. 3C TaxID=1134055 RepID=UPI00035CEA89|nr:glucose-6-phosphate dehydrogenase [Verrucomicrobium sp. 3C]
MNRSTLSPTILVIFGAAGDLSWRMLIPALYCLSTEGCLPEKFAIIGIDRKEMTKEEFQSHLRAGVESFCRLKIDDASWSTFTTFLAQYHSGDLSHPDTFGVLAKAIDELRQQWGGTADPVFYLATSPTLIEPIAMGLGKVGLGKNTPGSRIVVEKPFGRDLASAQALNRSLGEVFAEKQIFRIDHYLGKETVQNILALRFGNAWFEPIWDRRYIDYVQITVAETIGVEQRGGYYEHAGALRDMVQNHLLQLLCIVAMEPPVSFAAEEVRNKKTDVLHAIRPFPTEMVHQLAVRGQYGAGWVHGKHVPAYRSEPDVSTDSLTETFVALKVFVDNWRWQDVPFYLRTGKRMPQRVSQVVISLRPVPHQAFPANAVDQWHPNRMILNIQPQESILLNFQAKRPGPTIRLTPVDLHFSYPDAFKSESPEAYETLLRDIIHGDSTLFMRADQVEAAWSLVEPILQVWESNPPTDFPNYSAGSWGPEAAQVLIARDGKSWFESPEDEE